VGSAPCERQSLTRIANKPKPYAGRFAPIRRTKPQKHKTRLCEAGRCPGKAGEISVVGNADTPRKPESLQAQFWAVAELCLKSCAPFGGA